MSSAVIPIVRVAILADSRLTEIALPADLPLRDILPAVERLVVPAVSDDDVSGGSATADPTTPVRLSLAPIGGAPFSLDASLGTVGVVDGDLLALQPVPAGPAAPGIVEDIADAAVIFSASRLKPWGPAHIQRGAVAGLIGLLWVGNRSWCHSPTDHWIARRSVRRRRRRRAYRGRRPDCAVAAGRRGPVGRRTGADRRSTGPGGAGEFRCGAGDVGRRRSCCLVADRLDPSSSRKWQRHRTVHGHSGPGCGRARGRRCEVVVAVAVGQPGRSVDRGGAVGHHRSSATVRAVGPLPAAGHSGTRRPHTVCAVVAGACGLATPGPDQRCTPDRIHRGSRIAQRAGVHRDCLAAAHAVGLGLVRGGRDLGRGRSAGQGVGLRRDQGVAACPALSGGGGVGGAVHRDRGTTWPR